MLLDLIKAEIDKAIVDGFTEFVCGGAEGVATCAAKLVLYLKEEYSDIKINKAM